MTTKSSPYNVYNLRRKVLLLENVVVSFTFVIMIINYAGLGLATCSYEVCNCESHKIFFHSPGFRRLIGIVFVFKLCM